MKKIPTLFKRQFENHGVVGITQEVTEGCEAWTDPECIATVKYDGACCAIIDGLLYKRYDAKKGKKPPEGAIACCPPDPVTGHWPHWVKCEKDNPADKWFLKACVYMDRDYAERHGGMATFEAIGPHFNGNPHGLSKDILVPHGLMIESVERTFEGVKKHLEENEREGIVFWYKGEPLCKIKRTDFGLKWPIKEEQGGDRMIKQPTIPPMPEVERNSPKNGELIYKQAAIDTVNSIDNLDAKARGGICFNLMGLPPAEPERKMGKWINSYPDIEPNPMFMYGICSLCGFEQSISDKLNFCPNCGAYMRGGKQE